MSQINEPPKDFVADKQGGGVHANIDASGKETTQQSTTSNIGSNMSNATSESTSKFADKPIDVKNQGQQELRHDNQ